MPDIKSDNINIESRPPQPASLMHHLDTGEIINRKLVAKLDRDSIPSAAITNRPGARFDPIIHL